jgi:hypothetical protein
MKIKQQVSTILISIIISVNLYSQNDNNHKVFDRIICNYNLPINRNGLTETSFWVTPRIRIERWEKNAQIILDIKKTQGTLSNPDPSFKQSYNYEGKMYGNQHVGVDPFGSIRAENVTFEVLVTYGSQSWGWTKVDGMTNVFNSIPKDAKASGVMVNVRIANVMFNGTGIIENKIRELLKTKEISSNPANAKIDNSGSKLSNTEKSKTTSATDIKNETDAQKKATTENTTSKTGLAKTKSSTEIEEEKVTQEELNQKLAEEKIAAAKAKADEEAEASRVRQESYDSWKTKAQEEKNIQDALSIGATTGMLFWLGGFIYDGMGEVDPYFVYQPPTNKYKPMFFMNNSFGYSGSMEPMLFQSNKTTMIGGSTVNTTENTNGTGYFINLGWQSNIGAGNDYYNVYGILAAKVGVVPTLTGYQYNMGLGAGMDVGIKNIKFFMSYKQNVFDEKSITSSDVEESGMADYNMPSGEFSYGLKFSFGGDKDSDFRRQHIYLGVSNKSFRFDSDSYQSYFDPIDNTLSSVGNPTMKGYIFEWRKDHTFSFFARYYENHIYVGDVNDNVTTNFYPTTNTYLEIGFLRTLDYFMK